MHVARLHDVVYILFLRGNIILKRGNIHSILSLLMLLGGISLSGFSESKPWSLRDHYSFSGAHTKFSVDVQTAEWKVDVNGLGTIVENAQAEIFLSDGTILRLSEMKFLDTVREEIKDSLGTGKRFETRLVASNGLQVNYQVQRYDELPFLTISIEVKNTGQEAIGIDSIRSVHFPKGTVHHLHSNVTVLTSHAHRRGDFSMVHEDSHSSLYRFILDSPKAVIGVGLLQSGAMHSKIDFVSVDEMWGGKVQSDFEPAIILNPAEAVESDKVWLSFTMDEAESVHQYHSWAEAAVTPPTRSDLIPNGWVTVEESQNSESLLYATSTWDIPNVFHALVPGSWPEKAGALKGDGDKYPESMQTMARSIRDHGMLPGITIDPLAVEKAEKDFTIADEKGNHWLDITNPKAIEYGTKRMGKVGKWTYEFFVVKPSNIPDSVLKKLNVTRASADMTAFELMKRGSNGYPVLPSAHLTMSEDVSDWYRAAETTEWYESYGVMTGPVRFNVAELGEVSSDLNKAIKAFTGPVEFTGNPGRKVRRQLAVAMVPLKYRTMQVSKLIVDPNEQDAPYRDGPLQVSFVRQD